MDAKPDGNAFVEQYYNILHQSPEQVYKFYQDTSLLSRPDPDGRMTTVTTMTLIEEKLRSWYVGNSNMKINSVDGEEFHKGGVIILVTGCLVGEDRKFTQALFLAPQNGGYFVKNDIFRFLEKFKPIDAVSGMARQLPHPLWDDLFGMGRPLPVVPPAQKILKSFLEEYYSTKDLNLKLDIETSDAQDFFKGAAIVLITGCRTEMDCLRRKFVQTVVCYEKRESLNISNDIKKYLEETRYYKHLTLADGIFKYVEEESEPATEPATSHVTSSLDDTPTNSYAAALSSPIKKGTKKFYVLGNKASASKHHSGVKRN